MTTISIQHRRDTAANWASTNPTLAAGEFGYETDTGLGKFGDGSTAWNSLLYQPCPSNVYRLTADGSAIGAAAADFFASAAFTLAAGGIYIAEWECYFLKTTAGTLTFSIVCAQTPVNINAYMDGGPVAGIGTAGAPTTSAIKASASTTTTIPATASLTTAVDHHFRVKAVIEGHATVAGTMKLQATESAGTITPRRGSTITVTRLPNVNYSVFA